MAKATTKLNAQDRVILFLPPSALLKDAMIETVGEVIAWKRSGAQSPAPTMGAGTAGS